MTLNSPFARKLASYISPGENELKAVADFYLRRRKFAPGVELVSQGEVDPSAYIMADGWAFSYKILPDGQRQIVNFQIPGDFLGARSILFRASDHLVFQSFGKAPRLGTAILWALSRDEAMVVEHLVGLGQRPAAERTAHLLLELNARLKLVGMGDRTGFACPLTQYHLADALGLTAVHINRVLRDIREAGWMTFQNGRVTFNDYDGLSKFADFDSSYLDQDGPTSPY